MQTKLLNQKQSTLCTLSKLVYTYNLRYSLASRAFTKAKYSVVCTEFPMGLKFHFSKWKIHFSQFIFIDKYLKFKEIEYFTLYIKFEMWPVLFYVNSLRFQQSISNWDILFFNSSLDSILGFLNVGLRLTSVFFLIHKKKIEL